MSRVVPSDIASIPPEPPGADAPRRRWRLSVWLRRLGGLIITALIFLWMFKPIFAHWGGVAIGSIRSIGGR